MTDLAPHLSTFLQQHLPEVRRFSYHTVQSYTDCFRLLVPYVAERKKCRPCKLKIQHFSASLITDFLESLASQRGNSVNTRNIRLAAIKSFFRYLEYSDPSCLNIALQVLAIPQKQTDKPLIDWLDSSEMQAVLDAPDVTTVFGLRDRAMLHLCYATGLRVSELITLTLDSFSSPSFDSIRISGKGRRERELPLWNETQEALQAWFQVRPLPNYCFVFFNTKGQALSTDGFAYILKKHVKTAAKSCSSLNAKRITPHVLRHSSAMAVLHSTRDVRKVSLWLGHASIKSTEAYLRASPVEKLEILEATSPPSIKPGAYPGVQDELMKLLSGE